MNPNPYRTVHPGLPMVDVRWVDVPWGYLKHMGIDAKLKVAGRVFTSDDGEKWTLKDKPTL